MTDLPTKLRQLRGSRSYRDMHALTGVHFSMWHKIELGDRPNPTIETLVRIADAFHISMDDLIGRHVDNCDRIDTSKEET